MRRILPFLFNWSWKGYDPNYLCFHVQVKAFLRGDSPPFSSGELEGASSSINTLVRRARTIQSTSLRYWLLEYLRRQPKEKKFRALILRFIKDRLASLLLMEVNILHRFSSLVTMFLLFSVS